MSAWSLNIFYCHICHQLRCSHFQCRPTIKLKNKLFYLLSGNPNVEKFPFCRSVDFLSRRNGVWTWEPRISCRTLERSMNLTNCWFDPEVMQELRTTAHFALRATRWWNTRWVVECPHLWPKTAKPRVTRDIGQDSCYIAVELLLRARLTWLLTRSFAV